MQDLVTHRTEIHNKLVGIMRERLIASLTQLPALAQRWTALPPGAASPSAFATSLAKQLQTLSQVFLLTTSMSSRHHHVKHHKLLAHEMLGGKRPFSS